MVTWSLRWGTVSNETSSTDVSRSVAPPSSASASPLGLFPAHLVVLTLLAGVALVAARGAAGAYQSGQAASSFGPDIRRAVAFGLLFNLAIALALLLGWIIELVATIVRVARKTAPPSRAFARLGLALLPATVLILGHVLLNPWLPALLRQLAALARGG